MTNAKVLAEFLKLRDCGAAAITGDLPRGERRQKLEDFKNGKLSNMIESGIIDPVKVTKTALLNAASCAGTLLTTNFGIIQTEDK